MRVVVIRCRIVCGRMAGHLESINSSVTPRSSVVGVIVGIVDAVPALSHGGVDIIFITRLWFSSSCHNGAGLGGGLW